MIRTECWRTSNRTLTGKSLKRIIIRKLKNSHQPLPLHLIRFIRLMRQINYLKKKQGNIMINFAGANPFCCQNKSTEEIPVNGEVCKNISPDSDVNDTPKAWTEIHFKENLIHERLAYADTSNFMHEKIYPCSKC